MSIQFEEFLSLLSRISWSHIWNAFSAAVVIQFNNKVRIALWIIEYIIFNLLEELILVQWFDYWASWNECYSVQSIKVSYHIGNQKCVKQEKDCRNNSYLQFSSTRALDFHFIQLFGPSLQINWAGKFQHKHLFEAGSFS